MYATLSVAFVCSYSIMGFIRIDVCNDYVGSNKYFDMCMGQTECFEYGLHFELLFLGV